MAGVEVAEVEEAGGTGRSVLIWGVGGKGLLQVVSIGLCVDCSVDVLVGKVLQDEGQVIGVQKELRHVLVLEDVLGRGQWRPFRWSARLGAYVTA